VSDLSDFHEKNQKLSPVIDGLKAHSNFLFSFSSVFLFVCFTVIIFCVKSFEMYFLVDDDSGLSAIGSVC